MLRNTDHHVLIEGLKKIADPKAICPPGIYLEVYSQPVMPSARPPRDFQDYINKYLKLQYDSQSDYFKALV